MPDSIMVSDFRIDVVRKAIKNVHLTVHPPDGRVRIAAPARIQLDTLRLYAIKKLAWIREQRAVIRAQARETARDFVSRESHYVWGRRYLLRVIEGTETPFIVLKPRSLVMQLRPGTPTDRRNALLATWYREQVRAAIEPLLMHWTIALNVAPERVIVRRMKTMWGSCTPTSLTIRLNTELARKPPECLEYILVHELIHLLEPTHNERFIALMDQHLSNWRNRRAALNRLPVRHDEWEYGTQRGQ